MQTESPEHKRNLWILGFLLVVVFYLGYGLYTDELQFFGKKTTQTTAVVTDVKMFVWGRGYYRAASYKQSVLFSFRLNNQDYKGSFVAGKSLGEFTKGDSILIKFALSDPNASKFVKRIKPNN